ncbi:MAG: NAD(P)H-dependent glycerol-3-phosphate dehydrogenase [Gammaproteobacteria bacterium]
MTDSAYGAPRTAVLVLGAGSWGTALAIVLARNGQRSLLWGRDPAHVADLQGERSNRRYLPGVPFPALLEPLSDLGSGLAAAEDIVLAVPLAALRPSLERLAHALPRPMPLALACKGVETGSRKLPHEIVEAVFHQSYPLAVISGPSFAQEAARGLPTAVTVAAHDAHLAARLVARLHHGAFRAYRGDDVIGVEVCGAVKNVLAIAAGISDGLGCGANARAALVTRGLAELTRFGVALGGRAPTFTGLAGLGDLVLTCTDNQSRNRRLGLAIGGGREVGAALAEIGQVIEGLPAAREIAYLAERHAVEMPIVSQVVRVLDGACSPGEAVQDLLARAPKAEVACPRGELGNQGPEAVYGEVVRRAGRRKQP